MVRSNILTHLKQNKKSTKILSEDIPPNLLDIMNIEFSSNELHVDSSKLFLDPVLKYNTIRIDSGVAIFFEGWREKAYAVFCDRLILSKGENGAYSIMYDMPIGTLEGDAGVDGAHGQNSYNPNINGLGRSGDHGKPGGIGGTGKTLSAAPLMIGCNEIWDDNGPMSEDRIRRTRFLISCRAPAGGTGGTGGKGGDGGHGEGCAPGDIIPGYGGDRDVCPIPPHRCPPTCGTQPGLAGNGGDGGAGGPGGKGGNGGNGGDLYLIGPGNITESMSSWALFTNGGRYGIGGLPGGAGRYGTGGIGWNGHGICRSSPRGGDGVQLPTQGGGWPGDTSGKDGKIFKLKSRLVLGP